MPDHQIPRNELVISLSKEQIKLIQRELRQAYEHKKSFIKYSVQMMAEEIQDFWALELPDEFRAAIPLPYRHQTDLGLHVEGKKRDNLRKFIMGESSSMLPLRLWAAFAWICWDSNEYSSLSPTDFDVDRLPSQWRFVTFFDTHLYQDASSEPALRSEHFNYSYQLNTECCICFGSTQNPHVLAIEMFEMHQGSEGSELVAYEGHLVLRSDDTGYAFLHSKFNADSRMYCFIPNGEDIFREDTLERFSLIELGGQSVVFTDELALPVLCFKRSSDAKIIEGF